MLQMAAKSQKLVVVSDTAIDSRRTKTQMQVVKQYTSHAGVRYQGKLLVSKPCPMHTGYSVPNAANKLFLHILN